ncbi:MAG TPA: single-stranded-DNA-specific exonuclease RecJ [Anaerolineaceae bacterium]|uniref:Single-stranded-DNA-specific exonuclease RecJ n=1 Tax=Anaerolinea thermophila TaxID=167964 RepID=A0A101FZ13_9CHLR|nr:MAG: Single-stranded-DNA-specific exonuclease RecJ [Anaerolinea thermophila]HAF61096.1 single-stranded-DNA-specific exonuclease RecJ [Anaerolineaceae bacterium]
MRWIKPQPILIPDELQPYYDQSPYLAEALAKKGILDAAHAIPFLDYTQYIPTDPSELPGVDAGTARILQAIEKKEKVGIWGDFDVDGQTSTALLVSFFREHSLPVSYHIPIRSAESHGILQRPLEKFLAQGIDLLITCDTGISAHEALELAAQKGVDVIITDHHTPSEILPKCLAAINPHFVEQDHPFANLSGVGTAYILTKKIAMLLGEEDKWERTSLDLVALGTIADVAPLTKENRYMVQFGLDLLRKNTRLGIKELLAAAETVMDTLDEQDVGFTIAPRLNAMGRLGDANPMVEFLLTDDIALARRVATELEGLNNQRKMLVNQVYQAAEQQIEQDDTFEKKNIIILWNENWPAGILGIVANHLASFYGKPAILLTGGKDGSLKGSARSIEGINITDLIAEQKDLLLSFGGHAMAAGLALPKENLDLFKQRVNASIASIQDIDQLEAVLAIDAYLPLENVTESFMQVLDSLAPFGAGNASPVFVAEDLQINTQAYIDRDKVHRSIKVSTTQAQEYEIKWWHAFNNPLPDGRFDLAYRVHRNVFRGVESIQIEWIDAQLSQEQPLALKQTTPTITTFDFRHKQNQLDMLNRLMQEEGMVCWAETLAIPISATYSRLDIPPCEKLALLQLPPSAAILKQIFARAHPRTVFFFNLPVKKMDIQTYLQTLLGMIKFALREKEGKVSLEQYAALTGSTPEMVKLGLQIIRAQGQISMTALDEDMHVITTTKQIVDPTTASMYQEKLISAFKQAQAFQRFLMRVSPHSIIQDYYEEGKNN